MEEKKEIQKKIIEKPISDDRVTQEEFFIVLRAVAPGTNLRTSLDGALKIGKGALIVVENENLIPLLDGGFKINTRFTPQKLMELTKMDGAIVLSSDMKRINYANVMLVPESSILTRETGTRHKAAERTAKQTGTLAIAISERKNEITLYYKNLRYPLVRTEELLRKANEQIQLLEKQRELFDKAVEKLNKLELRNYFNLKQAILAIQKGRIIQKISDDLDKYSIELGKEGTLLNMRLKEITFGVDKEVELILKDYTKTDLKKSKWILDNLSYEEILDEENIRKLLDYEIINVDGLVRGWRMLEKTSLSEHEIAEVVRAAENLENAVNQDKSFYVTLFGPERAEAIKEEISRLKVSY